MNLFINGENRVEQVMSISNFRDKVIKVGNRTRDLAY